MQEDVKTYDVAKYNIAVNGRYLTGFVTGGKCTTAHNTDTTTPYVGCMGDVIYQESSDNTGTATVTLVPTSASLPFLRDLCVRRVPCELTISDANVSRRVAVQASDCRITKVPDVAGQATLSDATVTLFIPNLEYR
ncbi:MAG: DUF3277 domain-containing protein [Oscillospiraceae bacterium]|jgi:hypothetical protein|nr:DUF3277 domain-containing protein [Oscillospiraceae bacterium]